MLNVHIHIINQSLRAYAGWRIASPTLRRYSLGFLRASLHADPFPIKYIPAGFINFPKPRPLWTSPWLPPPRVISFEDSPIGRVNFWEACHMPIYLELALLNCAGNRPRSSLTEQAPICYTVKPATPHDPAKTLIAKGRNSPLQVPS